MSALEPLNHRCFSLVLSVANASLPMQSSGFSLLELRSTVGRSFLEVLLEALDFVLADNWVVKSKRPIFTLHGILGFRFTVIMIKVKRNPKI